VARRYRVGIIGRTGKGNYGHGLDTVWAHPTTGEVLAPGTAGGVMMCRVQAAKRQLGRSRVSVGTVVAYPHGGQLLAVKAFEASKALEQGANQIDFVINAGALLSGEDEVVFNDMLAVIDMAHSALAACGVIVETEPLPDELLRKACRLAERAGADYVVTSAGNATARSTLARTSLIRDSLGPRVQVKASGRLRSVRDIHGAADAGAARVSTRLTTELVRGAAEAAEPAGARS
jgi:deoxyribose-phosphate aldolase